MSYLIALSLVTCQYMRSAGLRRLYCFLTNRTKIKILNYGQTKEVNQNVSTRSGRGDADPSFLLFFQENLLSCTFFIAFLNLVFCFQNIKVKKILIATKANKINVRCKFAPLIVYFELMHTGILRPLQKQNSLSYCSMLKQGGGSGIKREGDTTPGGGGVL